MRSIKEIGIVISTIPSIFELRKEIDKMANINIYNIVFDLCSYNLSDENTGLDVELKEDIGKYKKGEKFDLISINSDRKSISFYRDKMMVFELQIKMEVKDNKSYIFYQDNKEKINKYISYVDISDDEVGQTLQFNIVRLNKDIFSFKKWSKFSFAVLDNNHLYFYKIKKETAELILVIDFLTEKAYGILS